MRTSAPALLPLFRSGAQLAILGALFVGPSRRWTISALADHLGLPVSTTAREVGRLAAAGIVTVTAEGRNRLVSANWELPWAAALANLLDQTIGPLALLSAALVEVDHLEEAWIFGSWAARHAGHVGPAPRDIDVLLVGDDLSQFDVAKVADAVAENVGVGVNPYTVSTDEWRHPAEGSFVADLQQEPRVRIPLNRNAHD